MWVLEQKLLHNVSMILLKELIFYKKSQVNQTTGQERLQVIYFLRIDIALLYKLYTSQIKQSCSFLSEVNIDLKSSGVCLESAYQLSLTVQTLWQHLTEGKTGAAFKDLETFLDQLPDTLDVCGDHTLANKIRNDFPAACLTSFDNLAKELVLFQHNFEHWEWVAKHWKDLEKVLKEVKTSCPLFA